MKTKIALLLISMLFVSSCSTITGLFERGGRKFVIEVKTTEPDAEVVTNEAVKVLSARLDAAGIRNKVTMIPPARVEVLAYGKSDPELVKKLILAESRFELAKVAGAGSLSEFPTYPTRQAAEQSLGSKIPSNRRVLPYTEREGEGDKTARWVVVETPPIIDGRSIRDASAYSLTGKVGDDYIIAFKLNRDGAEKFGDWTGKNIGSFLAIVLNDEVKSAPVIKGQIFDSGQIEGRFTKLQAEDLALILKSGYLPATLTLIDEAAFE